MIKHVVCFRLKDRSPENITRARDVIMGMEGKIPGLQHLEAGINAVHSERSFDLVLIACFDDLAGLAAYQIHPLHMEVSEYLGSVRDSVVSVDFQV